MNLVFEHFDLYLRAFGWTVLLFLASAVASLVIGTILSAMRVGPVLILRWVAAVYVAVVRNTPLVLWFLLIAQGLPMVDITFRDVEKLHIDSYYFRACLALTLYTSTFVGEAIRSGINSVGLGQAEAARAIGLTFLGTMRNVVLPQAFRASVPPLASVMIALLKNTSVAYVFGVYEATTRMKYFSNITARDEGVFILFALGYVVLVELVSLAAGTLERRWKVARA
ncbi:amino acid ABC transporter permease [Nocardioides sp. KR10-350]|uniref:amino acid ABC transporter permease n=1 Tax=Nocardioides cheoyonin TaxID=3156615 RepID=UPI0032B58A4C